MGYQNQPLIHHSDRGLQYCSKLYTDYLTENNINITMSENISPTTTLLLEKLRDT